MRILLYTLTALLFCSCSVSSRLTKVEILKPSNQNLNFSEDDRIIMVANYRDKSKYYTSKTIAVVDDSSQVAETANAFVDYYKNIGYFKAQYVPIKYKKIEGKQQEELTPEEIEKLTLLDKSRYVVEISLNRTLIEQTSSYSYKAIFATLWRIYDAEKKQMVKEVLLKDSLYYDQYQKVNRSEFEDAVSQDVVGKIVGQMGSTIFPHWNQEFRYYMLTVDPDFNRVENLIQKFKWKEVISLMTQYLTSDDKNFVYAASFNIAMACEMTGSYDLALKWLDKCDAIKRSDEVKVYRAIIENRAAEEKDFDSNN